MCEDVWGAMEGFDKLICQGRGECESRVREFMLGLGNTGDLAATGTCNKGNNVVEDGL